MIGFDVFHLLLKFGVCALPAPILVFYEALNPLA